MSVVSNSIKDAQKYIIPKWLSVWSTRVKAVNKNPNYICIIESHMGYYENLVERVTDIWKK